jgi:predicted anti-sigma-YlaC factor YlaD
MRYLDGEMSEDEKRAFAEHIEQCPDCAAMMRKLAPLCEMAEEIQFTEPEREVWDRYWNGVLARTQRGAGWSLTALGLAILCGFALTYFFAHPAVPGPIKIGAAMLFAGLLLLFVTVLIARLKSLSEDKYREIDR